MPAKNTMILVADDDPQAMRLVTRNLQAAGYEVIAARDGQQVLQEMEIHEPDLILLDLLMPKLNGFEVCEYIRTFSSVPIIVITGRGQVQDKARALDAGADDYITKPFSIVELLARVRAVLRRTQWNSSGNNRNHPSTITIGALTIDFPKHQVTVDDRVVTLTPIEYRILWYLVQNAGRIVTHDLLLEYVWGTEYIGENHLLKVNINRLRNKIEPYSAHPTYILTRTGLGYLIPTHPEMPSANGTHSEER